MEDLDKELDKIDKEYEENKKELKEVKKKNNASIFDDLDDEEEIIEEPKKEKPEKEEKHETVTVIKKDDKDSYFDGGLFELIGYKILGFLIIIFTLGIARSWAICMIIRYKVNHTVLNGKRLKFEGKGSDLFVERLKWLLLSIITLGIYLIFKPVKMIKWEVSQIHFEDENFIKGESFFDAGILKLIGINILCGLINLITIGLAYPITECMKVKWIVKHSVINKKKLVFTGSGINLFLYRLLWGFLTIITLGIFGLWLGIKHMKFYVKNTHIKKVNEQDEKDSTDLIVLIIFIVVGLLLAFIIVNKALKYTKINTETTSVDTISYINTSLDAGADEVVELMKYRDDKSAGASDYFDTLASMKNTGIKGNYGYSTTNFITGFDYDLSFHAAYKGYYCEKYYQVDKTHDINCYKIFEDNGGANFFEKPLYKYIYTIVDSIIKKQSWYSVN